MDNGNFKEFCAVLMLTGQSYMYGKSGIEPATFHTESTHSFSEQSTQCISNRQKFSPLALQLTCIKVLLLVPIIEK